MRGAQTWRRLLLVLVGIVCCLSSIACQPTLSSVDQQARVSKVTSGQTIEILSNAQNPLAEKVVLLGISAPWFQQAPWGEQAWQRLQELAIGKTVELESDIDPQTASDVRQAYVWLDGELLNEKLVAEGWAIAHSRSPNTKYEQRLAYAQEQARLLGLGIWNPTNPLRQTPAEYRSQHPNG